MAILQDTSKAEMRQLGNRGRRHDGRLAITHIIMLSLIVCAALRIILEKSWLGRAHPIDAFSLFLNPARSASTSNKRILVVLPMLGLKRSGLIEDDIVTEERLAIQSWNLMAEYLAASNFSPHLPNGPMRVLGMVGALNECDPWLNRFVNPTHYTCQVLPTKCLHANYDDIPTLDCLLETAVDEAKENGEELILFANSDLAFAFDLFDVVSSIYGSESILMKNSSGIDARSQSQVVVVGQRTDVFIDLRNTSLLLTREALMDIHRRAKIEGNLHQDFGIDYFIFPITALPCRLPPFLIGRFRWDNALLATFLMQGATTVDATETLSVVHFGVHASDTSHHLQRLGSQYNEDLVHDHFKKAFMLGRISNTEWIHQVSVKDTGRITYALLPRQAPTDANLLQAFRRATFDFYDSPLDRKYGERRVQQASENGPTDFPVLLLIAVSTKQEIPMFLGSNASALPLHAMFVTKDPDIYSILDSHFAGRTFLEPKVNWSSPAAAIEWQTFARLLTNNIGVVLTNALTWAQYSVNSKLTLEHPDWNLQSGDVSLHPKDVEQLVGIRPTQKGLAFWDAYKDCHSAKGRENMVSLGAQSDLADRQIRSHYNRIQTPQTRNQCLKAIRIAFASHDKPSMTPFPKMVQMKAGAMAEKDYIPLTTVYSNALSPFPSLHILVRAQDRLDQVRQTLDNTSTSMKPSSNEKLHMILTITNPGMYASRYILARDFIQRITRHDNAHVELYVVECAYNNQTFNITHDSNPRHLQVRASTPLWHKENLINLAVARLLPPDWQALAWVDGEIEFESPTWAVDALRLLLYANVSDIIQLFSFAEDLGEKSETVNVYTGFVYNYVKQIAYQKKGVDLWHPGYAWGCSRRAYEQIGGLFEGNILGGGDQCIAYALLGMHADSPDNLKLFPSQGYKEAVCAWERRFKGLRMGYVPGVIQHHYHGSVQDRKYWERRDLLSVAGFDPQKHVTRDKASGVLVPTQAFPPGLAANILNYFQSRKEDTIFGLKPQDPPDNPTRDAIANNKSLRGPLPVIILIPPRPIVTDDESQDKLTMSDVLIRHYLSRFQHQNPKDIDLYIIEVAPTADSFQFTSNNNPHHLQHIGVKSTSDNRLRNLAIESLLPVTWEAMAWVDIGAELESRTWARDVLRLLTPKSYDVVQLFSHAAETDAWGNTTSIRSGFGYNQSRGVAYVSPSARQGISYPRGGWAYSRRAFDGGPGLLELSEGANSFEEEIQAQCLVGMYSSSGEGQKAHIMEYEASLKKRKIRVGYVPGVLKQWTQYTNITHPTI